MATDVWIELPKTSGGGGGGSPTGPAGGDLAGTYPNPTVPLLHQNSNTISGFDNSGNLESIPGFNIDTTSGGPNIGLTEHPNNVGGGFTVSGLNVGFEPIQNSPDDDWNIQNYNINLDASNSGFSQGTNGEALTVVNLNVNHGGTGPVGGLNQIKTYFDLGNGTDPLTIKNTAYMFAFGDYNDNLTIDGSIQGYDFQPHIHSGVIGTSNFNISAFEDFANVEVPVHGYTSFQSSPSLAGIANNSNYNGIVINPNITSLTGNAGATGYGHYGTVITMGSTSNIQTLSSNVNITTMGTNSNYSGININPNITTMGTSSSVQSANFGGTITTSRGTVQGININPQILGGDANFTGLNISPNGGVTIGNITGLSINLNALISSDPQGSTGISSDSRLQINATTTLQPAQGFQIGSRIENLYHIPSGSPVTGTDSLGVNIAGDLSAEDNMANGPIGIGFNSVGFIASLGVALGKTVDTVTVFLPASSTPDPGYTTGGHVNNFHMIRTFPPLPQGGTLTIDNLYAFKLDSAFGDFSTFATNAYVLYLDSTGILNKIGGGQIVQTHTVSTTYTVDSGSIKDYQIFVDTSGAAFTITLPTPINGRQLSFKDSTGSFATNNLTLDAGAHQIDGVIGTSIFSTNYQSISLVSNGSNWFEI